MRKLKISPYSREFPEIFEKEKRKISKAAEINDIRHIGSTAVPGLGGKGIVDIMIGVKSWREARKVVEKLGDLGFIHIHPKEKGRIFLSKKKITKKGNIHFHIVKKESRTYKKLLIFRDYLRKHRKEVNRFFRLKLKWIKETEGDRLKYNKLKEDYIKEILKKQ